MNIDLSSSFYIYIFMDADNHVGCITTGRVNQVVFCVVKQYVAPLRCCQHEPGFVRKFSRAFGEVQAEGAYISNTLSHVQSNIISFYIQVFETVFGICQRLLQAPNEQLIDVRGCIQVAVHSAAGYTGIGPEAEQFTSGYSILGPHSISIDHSAVYGCNKDTAVCGFNTEYRQGSIYFLQVNVADRSCFYAASFGITCVDPQWLGPGADVSARIEFNQAALYQGGAGSSFDIGGCCQVDVSAAGADRTQFQSEAHFPNINISGIGIGIKRSSQQVDKDGQ